MLLRKIRGNILLIWDGATIHRSKVLKAWLACGAAKRIHLEQLPGYAPELNPDEGIWQYLKGVELANVCCQDMHELQTELVQARERLRHKRNLICGMFPRCGYYHLSFFVPLPVARWSKTACRSGGIFVIVINSIGPHELITIQKRHFDIDDHALWQNSKVVVRGF